MAATAVAGGQKEDPIEEDESDIGSATINFKKPWTRTSSPPRRLQTSMSLRGSAVNQDNLLPPRLNASGSHIAKGQPITLQRLVQHSPPNGGAYGRLKPNSSARLGAFRPLNNLARGAPRQPYSKSVNGSSIQKPFTEGPRKKRRKLREVTNVSDGEDELAGPAFDRSQSTSPIKKAPSTTASSNPTNERGQSGQTLLSITGLDTSLEEPGGIPHVETQKQRRERGRQHIMLKNRRQRLSETTSPYFTKSPGNIHNEGASSRQTPNRSFVSQMEDSSLIDMEEGTDVLQVSLPSVRKGQASQSKRDDLSTAEKVLLRSEKSWNIKSFQDDKHCYEQGSVELLLDTQTKVLGFRVNGQKQSCSYHMSNIFEVKFSESLIRLHFRGTGHQIAWILTEGNAETIIEYLQDIQKFQAKPEHRAEQMFTKWKTTNSNRIGASPSKISIDQGVAPQFSPINTQPTLNNKRLIVTPDDSFEQGQANDAPKSKRQKLSARLVSGPAHDDLLEPSTTTSKRTNQLVSDLLADIGDGTLERPFPSHNHSDRSTINNEIIDTTGLTGYNMEIKKDVVAPMDSAIAPDPTATQRQELPSQSDELKTPVKKQGAHISTRPTRLTRAQRQYISLEQPEHINIVEKYSKTRGLGPRWTQPLIWPRNGRKRVTVEFDDLERLDEEEFLNDNLVEFALRWMRSVNDDPSNIYWFNTYFFERLNKGKGKQIDYNGVKRWTKDIDLFSHDCVVVPINENYHWYLAIIYNLPQLKKGIDTMRSGENLNPTEEVNKTSNGSGDSTSLELLTESIRLTSPRTPSTNRHTFNELAAIDASLLADEIGLKTKSTGKPKGRIRDPLAPTIVTLDSLGFAHPQAISTLKSYLRAEARERLGLILEKDDIAGMTAKGIPSQDNLSDCGVYLLGYVALMLRDSDEFRCKLLQKEFDEETDWQHLRPRDLRNHLRRVIQKKYKNQVKRNLKKRKNGLGVSSDELSSELSSDDTQLLGPLTSFKKRASLPESNTVAIHEQRSRFDTAPKNTTEHIAGSTSPLHPRREGSSLSIVHTHSLDSSAAHPIRIKTFNESSTPPPLQKHEVPETPQGSPARDVPDLTTPPTKTLQSDPDHQRIIPTSPSTPLSTTSSFFKE